MKLFLSINEWSKKYSGIINILGIIIALIPITIGVIGAPIARFFSAGNEELLDWIALNRITLSLISLFIFSIIIYLRILWNKNEIHGLSEKINVLESSSPILLDESTAYNINNWQFTGNWSSNENQLIITNSHEGGIFKIGASWENYILKFDFKVINKCAAWIIRANSLNKYYMIQVNDTQIRPHIRSLFANPGKNIMPIVDFGLIKEIEHKITLKEWNSVKTEVRGYSINVSINDKIIFTESDALSDFKLGTIGFRCHGDEQAIFKNIIVEKI